MKKKTTKTRTRSALLGALVLGALCPLYWTTAMAQSDPTAIGAGQKPFVLILLDSSGSMEYTSEGDNFYPKTNNANPTNNNGQKLDYWELGKEINNGDSSDYEDDNGGNTKLVGPCYVWRTKCNQYERPPWKPNNALLKNGSNRSYQENYVNDMRDNVLLNGPGDVILSTPTAVPTGTKFRRLKNASQPRHVQFKEILTGDMILLPRSGGSVIDGEIFGATMNPEIYGPGCWFVPRMHGALINPDSSDLCYDESKPQIKDRWDDQKNAFNKLVDFNDTRPHFQEVFDLQLKTGLMDILEHNVVFAVAMFDGYQGDLKNGSVRSEFPNDEARPNQPNDGTTRNVPGHPNSPVENGDQTYNMGVYKIVGPKSLWRADAHIAKVAAFTQLAIVDAGYLHNKDGDNDPWKVDPKGYDREPLNITIENLDGILPVYYAGQQSMSGDTPLAAAVYDIHNYFLHGQAEFNDKGEPKNYDPAGDCDGFASPQCNSTTDNKDGYNPVMNDRYLACRAKHVIMMTDGAPAPEAPGGENDLGTEVLNGGFGYKEALAGNAPNRYRYQPAEFEINAFVSNTALNPKDDPRFKPHVHVVGLNPVGNEVTATQRQKIAEKLGAMARNGGTCAQYWLSQSPEGLAFLTPSQDSNGTCNPTTDNCLVTQLSSGNWNFPIDNATYDCVAPAVLLSKNDQCSASNNDCSSANNNNQASSRDDMTFVLSLIFNEILSSSGGIASRTRPAVAERLDTADKLGQHRIFSGVQVSGASRYWKGLLNRQELLCKGDDSAEFVDNGVTSLHDEIAHQVKKVGNEYHDNRRIFTSFRAEEPSNAPHQIPTPDNETSLIISGYELKPLAQSSEDEFRGTSMNMANGGDPTKIVGTRVPFLDAPLSYAAQGISIPSDPNVNWNNILTVTDHDAAKYLIDVVRGRIRGKEGRILGAIVRSNPVVVGPPSRDLPIESYREFKKKFRNRPSMLYVSTLDGLLHGIYNGEHNGDDPRGYELKIRRRETSPFNNGADTLVNAVTEGTDSQREAWAYVPQLLHNAYAGFLDKPAKLMDGSPVVRDVRLCHPEANLNQNQQACLSVNSTNTVPPAEQWRTVLVTGLGESGSGYFAMDVTRTGQDADNDQYGMPDPTVLWEFGPEWERKQIQKLQAAGAQNRYGSSVTPTNFDPNTPCLNGQGLGAFDASSYMGLSVGDPEIATVILQLKANVQRQRPVAIFTGGDTIADSGAGCLSGLRQGRAIYVVDLQTGTLLRRFVTYSQNGTEKRFDINMSGTPVAYNNNPGTVANRAFVGDDWSRLFRLDMSSSDPSKWRVDLMYDPCEDAVLKGKVNGGAPNCVSEREQGRNPFGPAAYRPAVALSKERNVIVTYGLGRRGDVSFDPTAQAVITLAEKVDITNNTDPENFTIDTDPTNTVLWSWVFEDGERLTGEPIIFNGASYFTTYVENQSDPCEAGTSRIYGLDFEGENGQTFGAFTLEELDFAGCPNTGKDGVICATDPTDATRVIWVGPEEPSLLRGLTATLGPVCSIDLSDPNNRQFVEKSDPQPTLIATMGGSTPPNNEFGGGNPDPMASNDILSRFKVRVKKPRSQLLPLSYVSLGQ